MFGLSLELSIILGLCLLAACVFEFINGFHDTANAVATVIYTHSLKPRIAVVWSGIMNFIGVYVGGIAVAMGIVNLLPTSILVDADISHGVSMIFALIFTAIIWNFGTWYFGIPCSSSHSLIGSIFGVGIAYALIPGNAAIALNWKKVYDVCLSLLISPLFGFGLALSLMILLKKVVKDKKIFEEPPKDKKPPFWIRLILILTCTSVSFSHGSNDGQKGVGLIMIILICFVPYQFSLDQSKDAELLLRSTEKFDVIFNRIDSASLSYQDIFSYNIIKKNIAEIKTQLTGITHYEQLKKEQHFKIRKNLIVISKETPKMLITQIEEVKINLSSRDKKNLEKEIKFMKSYTEFAPWWVLFMVSISLGLGTMIGWKRIVVTIGEKIGKTHLTYAQGASAELVAASTIGISTFLGLPVSTTHVLSSGVAGTMIVKKGGGLRIKTIRNIAIAWLITLPVTILLSGSLFLLLRWILK